MNTNSNTNPVETAPPVFGPDTKPLDVTLRQVLVHLRTGTGWDASDEIAAPFVKVMHKLFGASGIVSVARKEFDDAISAAWAKGTLTSAKSPRIRVERNTGGEVKAPVSLDEEFGL